MFAAAACIHYYSSIVEIDAVRLLWSAKAQHFPRLPCTLAGPLLLPVTGVVVGALPGYPLIGRNSTRYVGFLGSPHGAAAVG